MGGTVLIDNNTASKILLLKFFKYYVSLLIASLFFNLDSSDTGSEKANGDTAPANASVPDADSSERRKVRKVNYERFLDMPKRKHACQDDCDEGLGDSEIGDTASSNGYHSSQAIHSDQSEDSSLTDSERTLVGDELSPRNNSPDIMGSEMEQDIEPLHAGIEVSKPECDAVLVNSEVSCPVHGQDDSRNMSSPEENTIDSKNYNSTECCKNLCTCAKGSTAPEPPVKRHFRAYAYNDYETGEKSKFFFVCV